MSDEEPSDKKVEDLDISKLNDELNDGERAATEARLRKRLLGLSKSSVMTEDAVRSFGHITALDASSRSLQEAARASSIHSVAKQVDGAMSNFSTNGIPGKFFVPDAPSTTAQLNAGVAAAKAAQSAVSAAIPQGYMDHFSSAQTAASRMLDELREKHRVMFRQIEVFADTQRSAQISVSFDFDRFLDIPRIAAFYDSSIIDRIGSGLAAADAAGVLGIQSVFNDEIQSIALRISEQVSALSIPANATSAALELGIPERLEKLLARSIAAQEALLEEHKDAAKDAKIEAAFHRRNATMSIIINLLLVLLTVALQIEERITDKDEAVRTNTEAVRELQQSFDSMASQMERVHAQLEAASEADKAADFAIVELLREISDNLSNQVEPED